jgi:hypothetical protein
MPYIFQFTKPITQKMKNWIDSTGLCYKTSFFCGNWYDAAVS